MKNFYPGACSICREPVAVGAGDYDTGSRAMRCGPCAGVRPADATPPKILVKGTPTTVAFSPASFLGGDLFTKYRAATSGARFEPSDKTNVAPIDKALGMVAALTSAGFLVDIPPDLAARLQASRAQQQSLVLDATERTSEVDAKLRERGLVLFPFQKIGIRWLASRVGALLADEMGLGKTIQAVVALPADAPALVCCPPLAKGVWAREIARWRPDLKVHTLKGRDSLTAWPMPGEVFVTNWDILPNAPPLGEDPKSDPWRTAPAMGTVLIGDEIHAIKSSKTKRTASFRKIGEMVLANRGRVWEITGTPLLNEPPELWNILQAADIAREAYGSWGQFVEVFNGERGPWGGYEWGTPTEAAATKLKRVCLRRMRADVLPELPEKTWQEVPVEITSALRLRVDKATKTLTAVMPTAWEKLLSDEDPFDPPVKHDLTSAIEEARRWIAGSESTSFKAMSHGRSILAKAKIPALIAMIEEFEEQEEPLIVFSAYRDPIDILADRPGWAVITGDTPSDERTRIEETFQAGKLRGRQLSVEVVVIGNGRKETVRLGEGKWHPLPYCDGVAARRQAAGAGRSNAGRALPDLRGR